MGPELALAIDATINENGALVLAIIRKAKEAHRFRDKCDALAKDAATLQKILNKNKNAALSFETLADFEDCLKSIHTFVTKVTGWNAFEVALEVFVKKRFPELKLKIKAVLEKFSYEVDVETLARQDTGFAELTKNVKDGDAKLIQGQSEMKAVLDDVKGLLIAEKKRRTMAFASAGAENAIRVDFAEDDSRLSLTFAEGLDVFGRQGLIGKGTLQGVGQVTCVVVERSDYTSHYLRIYRDIQYGASVQKCYGILQKEDAYYAVLQSVDGLSTLSQACSEGSIAKMTYAERIGLAHELAKSVAWLHKAEIVLRSLSDEQIYLSRGADGTLSPVVTGLERAREFLMKTTHLECDTRYEAPEFQAFDQHTYFSDVWSLGTVIWQCVSGKLPFDLPGFVRPKSGGAKKIRELLRQKMKPGDSNGLGAMDLIIQQCWNPRADQRPPAAGLVRMLQQIHVQLPEESPGGEVEQPDQKAADIQSRLAEDIVRVRALNPPGKATKFDLPPNPRASQKEFEILFADGSWDSVKSYVVGAALFWELVHPPLPIETSVDVLTSPQLPSDDVEQRQQLALKHLYSAARGGYSEAFYEIWRSQAVLARHYKAKYDEKL